MERLGCRDSDGETRIGRAGQEDDVFDASIFRGMMKKFKTGKINVLNAVI
jgi:hypothetical protein